MFNRRFNNIIEIDAKTKLIDDIDERQAHQQYKDTQKTANGYGNRIKYRAKDSSKEQSSQIPI
ncbi:hypothetical protein VoSk93_43530 [Vibrio owensii]